MVAINKGDCLCPQCGEALGAPRELVADSDSLKRTVYGWCTKCNTGFEIVEVRRSIAEAWRRHKYRWYASTGNMPTPSPEWIIVEALKGQPLVLIGPGGDFQKQVRISEGHGLRGVLSAVSEMLD